MRTLILGLTTGLTLLGLTLNTMASDLHDIYKGSLKLYDGDTGICSTTLVDDRILLTAAHCVDGDNLNVRREVRDEDFNLLREEVVYVKATRVLKDADVAILEPLDKANGFTDIFGPYVSVVDVATPEEVSLVEWGTSLWAVGYPKASDLTITDGLFTGYIKSPSDLWETPLYKSTTPITGGNSGGGLYAELNGEYKLIGVTVGGYRDVEFMNVSSPIKNIQAVLKGFITAKTIEIINNSPENPGTKTDEK